MNRRKHLPAFKIAAAERCKHESVSDVAKSLGLAPSLLYGWIKKHQSAKFNGPTPPMPPAPPAAETPDASMVYFRLPNGKRMALDGSLTVGEMLAMGLLVKIFNPNQQ